MDVYHFGMKLFFSIRQKRQRESIILIMSVCQENPQWHMVEHFFLSILLVMPMTAAQQKRTSDPPTNMHHFTSCPLCALLWELKHRGYGILLYICPIRFQYLPKDEILFCFVLFQIVIPMVGAFLPILKLLRYFVKDCGPPLPPKRCECTFWQNIIDDCRLLVVVACGLYYVPSVSIMCALSYFCEYCFHQLFNQEQQQHAP